MDTRTSRYPSPRRRTLSRHFSYASIRGTRRARGRGRFSAGTRPVWTGTPFLAVATQQVKTIPVAWEIGRALLALGGFTAWAFVILLIAT
jgi:hypothetical protein